MLSVPFIPTVAYAECRKLALCAECHYAEYQYAECHGCRNLESSEVPPILTHGLMVCATFGTLTLAKAIINPGTFL